MNNFTNSPFIILKSPNKNVVKIRVKQRNRYNETQISSRIFHLIKGLDFPNSDFINFLSLIFYNYIILKKTTIKHATEDIEKHKLCTTCGVSMKVNKENSFIELLSLLPQ